MRMAARHHRRIRISILSSTPLRCDRPLQFAALFAALRATAVSAGPAMILNRFHRLKGISARAGRLRRLRIIARTMLTSPSACAWCLRPRRRRLSGPRPVPGAPELVAWLLAAAVAVRFATNNSMSPCRLRRSAGRHGHLHDGRGDRHVHIGDHRAPASACAAGPQRAGRRRRWDAGRAGRRRLRGRDGRRCRRGASGGAPLPRAFDAVLVGLEPLIDYADWPRHERVDGGARLVATNADTRYRQRRDSCRPGSDRRRVATATGIEPETIGKPEPAMFLAILEASGSTPTRRRDRRQT